MCAAHTDVKQMKIETPFKAQTLKMRLSLREKRKLRINENTKNFHESLSLYFEVKFSFNRWFVSGVAGHLRTWILAYRITLPYQRSITGTQRQKWYLLRMETHKNHTLLGSSYPIQLLHSLYMGVPHRVCPHLLVPMEAQL